MYISIRKSEKKEKEKNSKGKGKEGAFVFLSHLSIARPSSALIFTAVGSVQTNSLPSPGM
jgi:hypothetical protein